MENIFLFGNVASWFPMVPLISWQSEYIFKGPYGYLDWKPGVGKKIEKINGICVNETTTRKKKAENSQRAAMGLDNSED